MIRSVIGYFRISHHCSMSWWEILKVFRYLVTYNAYETLFNDEYPKLVPPSGNWSMWSSLELVYCIKIKLSFRLEWGGAEMKRAVAPLIRNKSHKYKCHCCSSFPQAPDYWLIIGICLMIGCCDCFGLGICDYPTLYWFIDKGICSNMFYFDFGRTNWECDVLGM